MRFAMICCVVALMSGPARADMSPNKEVDAVLQASIHLKILSYDNNLKLANGGPIRIGILYGAANHDAKRRAREIGRAFKKLAQKVTVHGRTVEVFGVPYPDTGLAEHLKEHNIEVLYLAGGLESNINAIVETAIQLAIPTLTGQRHLVLQGVAAAVVPSARRSKIVVHYQSSRAQGMALSSRLLRLAEIVDRDR